MEGQQWLQLTRPPLAERLAGFLAFLFFFIPIRSYLCPSGSPYGLNAGGAGRRPSVGVAPFPRALSQACIVTSLSPALLLLDSYSFATTYSGAPVRGGTTRSRPEHGRETP